MLVIYDTRITDAGLKDIKDLKNLTTLDLGKHRDNGRRDERTQGTQKPTTLYLYENKLTTRP